MSSYPFNNLQNINQPTHPNIQNLTQIQDSDQMILDDPSLSSISVSQSLNNCSQTFNPAVFNQGQMQAPQSQFQQSQMQNYQPQLQHTPAQMHHFQQAQLNQLNQMQQIQQVQQMGAKQAQFQMPGQPQKAKLAPISQFQNNSAQQFQPLSIPIQNYQPQYQMPPIQPQYNSIPINSAQTRPVQYQQPQYSGIPISNAQTRPVQYQQPQYNSIQISSSQAKPMQYQQPQYSSIPINSTQTMPVQYQQPQYSSSPISNVQTRPVQYQQPQIPMQSQPSQIPMPYKPQSVQIRSLFNQGAQNAYSPEDLSLIPDDDEIQIKPITEEIKTSEGSITASMNFLFNYLELKNIEQEIPCTLSLAGSEMEMEELQSNRAGLDLICVVDVSGSMRGPKLDLVKKTLEFMLTLLNGNDRVSIIVFSDASSKIIKLTAINEIGKIDVERAIRSMQTIGGTNIVSGLQKGLEVAINRRIVNQVTSVLLLTDGCDNERPTIVQRAIQCSNQLKSSIRGTFTVHTFGYGQDHDSKAMQEIAKANNGNFYYVENPKDIAEAFANCLGELVSVVADKIEVALITQSCSIPFHLHKVYSENGDTHFSMPSVLSGNKKDSVFLLKFPPTTDRVPENEIIKPVKARISYETKSGENKIIEAELSILVVNEGRDDIEVNEDVMVHFYRCKGAEILKEVARLAEARNFNEAKTAALNYANELKNCIVKEHEVVKALIRDLEDASNRASSNASWEQGGRAQVSSLQTNNFCQKPMVSLPSYQNACQTLYSNMASNYFNNPKNP